MYNVHPVCPVNVFVLKKTWIYNYVDIKPGLVRTGLDRAMTPKDFAFRLGKPEQLEAKKNGTNQQTPPPLVKLPFSFPFPLD